MNKIKQLFSFLIISVIAFLFLAIGLRLYFDDQRLAGHLEKIYSSSYLVAEKGQKNQKLGKIYWGEEGEESDVSLKSLNIQTYWYKNLVIQFLNKDSLQSLKLNILGKLDGKEISISLPILYTKNQTATINFDKLKINSNNFIITQINLSTPSILEHGYAIESITFHPKSLSLIRFFHLLAINMTNIPTLLSSLSDDSSMLNDFDGRIEILPFNSVFLLYILCFFWVTLFYKLWHKIKIEPFIFMLLSSIWIALDINLIKKLLFVVSFLPRKNKELMVFNSNSLLFGLIGIILWIMGAALSANCLKKRYGYSLLNISLGFWFAVLILIVGTHFSEGFQKIIQSIGQWRAFFQIIFIIMMLLLISIATYFIYKFIPSRLCTMDEHRLEKAPSNNSYFYSILLLLAVVIHVVFIVLMNVKIPHEEPLTNLFFTPLALSLNIQLSTVVVIIYSATLLSLILFLYGALRYIGFSVVNTCIYLYLFSSLPIWLACWHILFISYLIGSIVLTITIVIRYKEWRMLTIAILLISIFIYILEFISSFNLPLQIKLIDETTNYLVWITSMLYSPWLSSLYLCVIMSFFILFRLSLMNKLNDMKGIVIFYGLSLFGLCFLGLLSSLFDINSIINFSGITIFLVLALPICYLSCLYQKDSDGLC